MWLIFAFISATIVGVRDFFKKISLQGNEIITVLCLVTVFSAFLFVPFILVSRFTICLNGSFFYVPESSVILHLCAIVKCLLLIACWICSFDGIKHLPLTVSGMIAAFGPPTAGLSGQHPGDGSSWQCGGQFLARCPCAQEA